MRKKEGIESIIKLFKWNIDQRWNNKASLFCLGIETFEIYKISRYENSVRNWIRLQ